MNIKKIVSTFLSVCMAAGTFTSAISETANAEYARVSVHDPSVVKSEDGSYYIIGSHLGAAHSDDLQNWYSAANSHLGSTQTTFFNNIYIDLAVPEKWSNTTKDYNLAGNMWAPDIIYNKNMGKYCMYLSVNGQVWNSSIVLCTSDKIDGPYTYQGTIVYSGFTNNAVNNVNDTDVPRVLGQNPDIDRYLSNGSWNASYGTNAIDPAVFYDENGNLWLVYGSWFGGIYMLELDEQTGLRDYNVKYETRENVSDAYMGKKAAGGNFVSGGGPYIEYMKASDSDKGYYYLFMSYGFFNSNGGYNMRIFRSENPDGPYVDQNGNSAVYPRGGDNIGGTVGERLMSNYQWECNPRPFKAQGHNSALMDDDGKLYVIYHTKFDDNWGAHEVRVHQLIMNQDGWLTAAPYEYSGESLSEKGHSMQAVAGDYDFIFHTLNQKFVNEQSADVEKPHTVTLNEDGTISGYITGTWSMAAGSPYMSLNFGGVTYKGAFLVQADESAGQTVRMTFTATGNNTCVWGSKRENYNPFADNVEPVIIDEGRYTLRSVNSGLYISEKDGNVIQSATQAWNIKNVGNGEYSIIDDNGNALTVVNGSSEDGANIAVSPYDNSAAQRFRLTENTDGSYSFMTVSSGGVRCIDVYNISLEDGANICQWEFWGGNGQKFILESFKEPEYIKGDVNADKQFTVADLVMMQKFLLGNASLTDWKTGDLCEDDRVDVFDLVMMRKLIISAQ
ncbi:MAG: family 43 glycosylhydrolase [Ruminococcus sp.]|nr:family 43 glycosylhydrolase [Ruminococcus sp.]